MKASVISKTTLRKNLRKMRREHVAAQPDAIRALLFHRPPAPLLAKIGDDAVIGLYSANADEAPAGGYAKFFHERGHAIALPAFTDQRATMTFREHTDPFGEGDLEAGPFDIAQPRPDAREVLPDVLFVPLIGFTASGERLGQGGGHYDRWLAEHPGRIAIGLAWDAQLCDALPTEPHDIALDAVITPTRMYGIS
ncbi:5-formyltetrahydrofolate cyclo-ligase [Erythrobacter rubeus]|uniref:5-formyltetrahydrofolate cyclo-ligase n=1 Tax=Erythrobacter rubeus TaxID=2760803 RepID=A0ABR8KN23_9SPHN|nr:5-formyltetrahydrofolate cyclo-ligase [Erythrobacter rubeus]MBD2842019.1 5-formyltetrahydrofolate cyclo-ligase [Erythrobacter rubeus]